MSVRTIESPGGLQLANIRSDNTGQIRIQSGFVKEQDLIIRLRQAVFTGVVNGVNRAFEKWSPSIALRTGRMRKAIRAMINQHVNNQVGSSTILIDLEQIVSLATQLIKYTQYHYQVFARTGLAFYKQPTTRGTKPFTSEDFARIFPPIITEEIRKAIVGKGFNGGTTSRQGSSLAAGLFAGAALLGIAFAALSDVGDVNN